MTERPPADLVSWAERSRLAAGLDLTATEGELARARSLRGALFLLTADRAHGRRLQPRHLNAAAAALPPFAARLTPRWRGFDLLGAVTAAGAMLLAACTVVRLEHGPHDWPLTAVAGLVAVALGPPSSPSNGGPPRRWSGSGSCSRAPWRGPISGHCSSWGLLRVPVRGDAVLAGAARLVVAADRGRAGRHGR
ncbi:hypothetical protein [Streptomyces sp. TRM70350]|uniref:hypothetical protein n=1 Tax=Streptomyces sp. TRM70350 TaxID=2856165 RepID=UPI0027DF66FC|nr:hypothetical protein [Streptomyces sp. TRM70350]